MIKTGQRRALIVASVALLAVLVLAGSAEVYRRHDFLSYFVSLKTPLVRIEETPIEETGDERLIQVDLHDEGGLEVAAYLKKPSTGEGPFPALIALGGVRTGKRVLDYVEDTHGVIALALDYPYNGKKSGLGVWEFIVHVPAIRRALFNTVPASMLAVDYLLQRGDVDPDRIVFVGGSVGAIFGPVVGAADERIDAVALLFGAGDLQAVLRANIEAPGPLAAAASWTIDTLVSPLEPLKYVGRISPRPIFMLNGTGDDRMPIRSSERLHEAAGDPKTIRWIDTGHLHIRSTEFHERVTGEFIAWLLENNLIDSAPEGYRGP
jgi:dienelactone hydrolase